MSAPDPAHVVLAVLVGSLVLFVTDALRYDLVAVLVVLALALTGCLTPEEAFRGFSSQAVVLIASMYVFGHAFTKCGLAEALGERLLSRGPKTERALMLRMTATSGLLSSVLSNTGVVATLIPVCTNLGRTYRIPASRLLMPMAFGSLLGGLITVIATSTNIAINETILLNGGRPFELFEFSPLGLILLALGCLYLVGPGRALLPRSRLDLTLTERYQVPKFVTEILVEPTSTLINRAVADVGAFRRCNVSVLGIIRAGGESPVLAPGPYNRIRADDTLILQGAPDDILRLTEEVPLKHKTSVEAGKTRLYSDDVRLVEAVIPAHSRFLGETLTSSEFRSRTGLNVLALAKHGKLQLKRLQDTVMEVGDTLLLQGHLRDIERARSERDLLVLDELRRPPLGRHAWITVAALGAVLLLAATTSISLAVLGLGGATLLLLTGVVRTEEVSRVVDFSVLVLVGGMLALGRAFERWELSTAVADWLQGLGREGLTPPTLLVLLLLITVGLTQVLNNVSTAVIMTPVALHLAQVTGAEARPFLMAVVTGSSLAFLSPVAHQANAMVMGPGGYRYKDYLRAGLPLALVTVAAAAWLIPLLWPFAR